SAKHESLQIIVAAKRAALAPAPRHGCEPAIVSAHQVINRDGWRSNEHAVVKRLCALFIEQSRHPQIIKSEVEQKGRPHQLKVAKIIVLVLVERREPAGVAAHEFLIVLLDEHRNVFTALLRGNE